MSVHAPLIPVPFYAPVRIGSGDAGPFEHVGQRPRREKRVARQHRSAMPDMDTELVYDQRGRCLGDPRLGWVINLWI